MLLPGLLCLLVSAPPTARAAEAVVVERYSLPNGLDVVLHDDDRYPLVAVRVVYHVGSAHDPVGKEGATHLLEHAMFDGTVHVAAGEHQARLQRAGASGINATTSRSLTSYFETVPLNRLALALWLESDRMGFFNPRIRRLAIDRQRKIVTQELAQRRRRDATASQVLALRTVLAPEGHPDHDQDAASVARITLDDLDVISQRYYGPANATLILAGALPPETKDLVDRYFGDLAGGERPPAPTPRPP